MTETTKYINIVRLKMKLKNNIGYIVAAILLCIVGYFAFTYFSEQHEIDTIIPAAPDSIAAEEKPKTGTEFDNFPAIDWNYWQSVNPDIVAWVTIPGTAINYPVTKASESNPYEYLYKNAYGNSSYFGNPFFDYEDKDIDTPLQNTVIYGHAIRYSGDIFGAKMFHDIQFYNNKDFAEEHNTVYLQTPTNKYILRVDACTTISGNSQSNRIKFTNKEDMKDYINKLFSNSMQLNDISDYNYNNMVTLVSCSKYFSENERTIVLCHLESKI